MTRLVLSLVTACFIGFSASAQFDVTFNVDMSLLNVGAGSVHLTGDFNNLNPAYPSWDPSGIAMEDIDGDGVYSVTLSLVSGSYTYKFVNGNTLNDLEGDIPFSCTAGSFTESNRWLTVPNETEVTYCFGLCCSDCPNEDIVGCTDPFACNYNPTATLSSGSCVLPDGCTNPVACNYNAAAECNDGSCIYTPSPNLYTDGFSDCSLWAADNASNYAAGYNANVNWQCGTGLAPSGEYAINPIASPTYANGSLIVDSDLNGSDGICENTWIQRTAPFDLTSANNVKIGFLNHYREWNNFSCPVRCLVEVSRDGVNWPSYETFDEANGMVDFGDGDGPVQARWEVFQGYDNVENSDNPEWTEFNISAVADGQQVWVRFRWSGSWGYAWMVDDLVVFENPDADLAIANYSYADAYVSTFEEYKVWHPSQSAQVNVAFDIENYGAIAQNGVTVSASENGSLIGSSAVNSSPSSNQNVSFPYVTPSVPGVYNITYNVDLVSDACPGDNNRSQTFEVPGDFEDSITGTGGQYAKDDGHFTHDVFLNSLGLNAVATEFEFFGNAQIHTIQAAMTGSDCSSPVSASIVSKTPDAWEFTTLATSITSQAVTSELMNTQFESPEEIKWMRFVFDPPIDVSAGDKFMAQIDLGSAGNIAVGLAQDGHEAQDGYTNQDGSYYYITAVPMIRFNLDPASAEATTATCMDPLACNFDDSGFYNDLTSCIYTIDPDLNIVADPDCGTCNGQLEIDQLQGVEDAYTYQWFNGDGDLLSENGPAFSGACKGEEYYAVIGSNCTSVTTNSVTPDNVDNFSFWLTDLVESIDCGASIDINYHVYVDDELSDDQYVADNTTVYLNETDNTLPSTCSFGQCDGVLSLSPITTTSYTIGAIYTDVCGDVYTQEVTFTISVTPANFELEMDADPTSGDTPLTVTFDNQTSDLSNYTFTWNFGDGTILEDNGSFVQHTYESGGLWDVTLTAVNNITGCTDVLFNPEYIWSVGDGCPEGCTDSEACNYDPEAECDDGSCLEFDACGECGGDGLAGCIDVTACNYDGTASCDDGSCYYLPDVIVSGANVVTAFTSVQYDVLLLEDATYQWTVTGGVFEGGSDTYQASIFWAAEGLGELCVTVTQGECPPVEDCLSIVIVPDDVVTGCTDELACNYDPEATTDNGTCILVGDACDDGNADTVNDTVQPDCSCVGELESIEGCTDPAACNYNSEAVDDDGSCVYVGQYAIVGTVTPVAFATETYTYTETAGSTYAWTVVGGIVSSGQGTATVEVVWGAEGVASVSVQETDQEGCIGEVVILDVVILPTDIEERDALQVKAYPNPATGLFTLEVEAALVNATYRLYDATGRLVDEGRVASAKTQISVVHLANGRYSLVVVGDVGVAAVRVVVAL